ncbi:hypothetical protein ACPV5A_03745 [Vibrio chagasii]|uniref:hypothetical protein n=1 Tax=Vibrio chagasii TaxID=170679 RepID=UPI0040685C6D
MKKNKHTPTSYFFDFKKWASSFNDNERSTSSKFNDGLIIGTLLREVDEKCSRLVEKSNGISEYELLAYQQFLVIELLIAIEDGKFTGVPDSVLEAIHESNQLCIKISTERFSEYKSQGIYHELHHLASNRIYLEKQWEKITKSNWSFEKKGVDLVLCPSAREVDFGERVAVQRFEDHLLQLSEKAVLDGGFVDPKIKLLPSEVFKTNDGFGVNFDYPGKEHAIQHQLILNQHPYYYMDYNNISLREYSSLKLLDVRYFWIVFISLSKCIINTFLAGRNINLPVTFSKEELVRILIHCIDLSDSQAEQLIDLHTNTKSDLADFYLKPLYKINDEYFISVGVFLGGQITRVIDEVVKNQLNKRELEKGRLFERNFKSLISEQICKNKILQQGFCRVLALGFKQSKGKQNEEIDIIIRIGETYLLIEAKSFIYRAGITGYHNNLKEMKESNAEQKVNFFIDEYKRFRETYDKEAKFEINPENIVFCYLTSVPHATGIKVNDMPVVDSSILERYFEQGSFELRNQQYESKLFKFYDDFEEAEKNLKRYLDNPPQLQRLKNAFSYVTSDHVMNLDGMNIFFQEAMFNLNEEQEVKTLSHLWNLADSWCRGLKS